MKKPTQKGLAIEYLTTRGFKQTPYEASSKYVLMTKEVQDNIDGPMRTAKYWIGKAGAVRVGTSPSNSTSVTASFQRNLAAWLKEQSKSE